MMMIREMNVVLMLRSNASLAVGVAMARQALSSAVHRIRAIIGRLMKPTRSESAATASPEASLSPLPRQPGAPGFLQRSYGVRRDDVQVLGDLDHPHPVPDIRRVVARVAERGV